MFAGLAVHSRRDILFVGGDDGRVRELTLSPTEPSQLGDSWSVRAGDGIRGLGVDWLFDRLYLLLESNRVDHPMSTWQIARCRFGGAQLGYVVTDIPSKPSQIEVDPFNGYLHP